MCVTRDLFERMVRIAGENLEYAYDLMRSLAFDDFDFLLYCALVRAYKKSIPTFTANRLYQWITGDDEATVSKEMAENISRRLEKMASTLVTLDLTEAVKEYDTVKGVSSEKITGSLIELYSAEVEWGDKKRKTFCLLGEPILRIYAHHVLVAAAYRELKEKIKMLSTENKGPS